VLLHRQSGFTLLEIMVVLAIAGLVLGVSGPMALKLYESTQYRSAVKDVVTSLTAARYSAISSGQYVDVITTPEARTIRAGKKEVSLSDSVKLSVTSAQSLNQAVDGAGVIRFFPDGTSTGGSISLEHKNGNGVRLRVDWLLGSITQVPL